MFASHFKSFSRYSIRSRMFSTRTKSNNPTGKNVALAVTLLSFVGAVYYTAINKMKMVIMCFYYVLTTIL